MSYQSGVILVFGLLLSINTSHAGDRCNYTSLPGKEFVFVEKSQSLQKFGYLEWKREPSTIGKKLDYASYAGKKGKLQEQLGEDGIMYWYVAIMETCEKVYTYCGLKSGEKKPIEDLENYTGIYFIDTLRDAESLVGKRIWARLDEITGESVLYTDDPKVAYPYTHLELLEVVGVHTKQIGHTRGAGPFLLVVKKQSGEEGYFAFYDSYFIVHDPIDPTWDKASVELIKQQKIRIGMSEQQVLLSWGKPERINKSVGSRGTREQWVYGSRYAYIEDGKLTSFQTSQ